MKVFLKLNIANVGVYLLLVIYSIYTMFSHSQDVINSSWLPLIKLPKYCFQLCFVQFIFILVFLAFSILKSLPILGSLLFTFVLGVWAVLMIMSPTHISFNEIYLAWLGIGIANLGFAIWALLAAKPKPFKKDRDILDQDFNSL